MQKKKTKKRVMVQVKPADPFNGDPSKIDYKDVQTLKKFITTRGRILPTEKTGVSAKCQRKLAISIKRARYIALIPYVQYV
ncbi:MAG: 30S ribosomal protein S18 [Candidatus Dojkabacteria bacterium]